MALKAAFYTKYGPPDVLGDVRIRIVFFCFSEMSGPMAGLSVESESDPKETFRLDRLRHQRHIEFVPTYGGGSVAEERVQRRLAAILAADVVDYSG